MREREEFDDDETINGDTDHDEEGDGGSDPFLCEDRGLYGTGRGLI